MTAATFSGGVHPPERKDEKDARQAIGLPVPEEVVIPVNQHFGPPIAPVVAVGDAVKRGQLIATGDGKMAVPLHSSVCGNVVKIESRLQSNNLEGPCVVIRTLPDQGDTAYLPRLDPYSCSREEALARIREAGLVGMGGAGFPVHVKLDPPPGKKIDFVIANGAECEPYLMTDEATMEFGAARVVIGLALSMRVCSCARGVIGLEDNKARLEPILAQAIRDHGRGADITVRRLKTKYPQGGERMLITALTGREVPSGGLPADCGCIVHNVGTLAAMADAFLDGKPLIDRPLTLAGDLLGKPANVIAPLGASAAFLAASVGGLSGDPRRIVFGGPMMGSSVPDASIPVQKNTSGILFLSDKAAQACEEGQCIRCGRCMRACSCRLSPALLNAALGAKDYGRAEGIGLMDCIECGTCSYVCPARIRLVQRFRAGKQALRLIKQREANRAR
jgi:electron transport complex protein RnfC